MARPYWSGQITISLVSFGVKLFVATEAKSQISFHQIDRATGERIRYQKFTASAVEAQQSDPDDAPAAPAVQQSQIVKGYEYEKGRYVTVEPEELAHLRVPSKHTMEVMQFVDEADIDPMYYEKPYFVLPDNDAQTEAFATVRQALLDTKKVALSKIAFAGREHVVAIAPYGQDANGGMMAYTMRYAAELRSAQDYFRDIKKVEVASDSLDLAKMLIQKRAGAFHPEQFVDGYEVALKELIDAKIHNAPVPQDVEPTPARGKVINLMDALRKSIGGAQPAAEEEAEEPAAAAKPPKKEPKRAAAGGLSLVKGAAPKAPAKASAKRETKVASKSASKRKSA
jgi:DNA end-binding protein Ku